MSANPTLCSFAAILALTATPYSCHKPTAYEQYAGARRCVAALGANLKFVPSTRFKQVGLDPDAVDLVFTDSISDAYDVGKLLNMRPEAINRDLQTSGAAYVKAHSWQPPGTARRQFIALGYDVNDCLADYYGRPND